MDAALIDPGGSSTSPRASKRRWPWVVLGVVALLAVVVTVGSIVLINAEDRPVPTFASLAAHPDRSLQGTVAYMGGNGCVRIVAAAGAPSKDVLCIPPQDMTQAPEVGKEVGPQLAWRPDGRLEITMFRMDPSSMKDTKKAPDLIPAWQKVADVRTGAIEETPDAKLPAGPTLTSPPKVAPDGRTLTTKSDQLDGRYEVVLTDANGPRTLVSVHGPGKYTYQLNDAFWAPSWQWATADDGRILVITTGRPSTTRVLVESDDRGGASGGTIGASYAVTATNFLTPTR